MCDLRDGYAVEERVHHPVGRFRREERFNGRELANRVAHRDTSPARLDARNTQRGLRGRHRVRTEDKRAGAGVELGGHELSLVLPVGEVCAIEWRAHLWFPCVDPE